MPSDAPFVDDRKAPDGLAGSRFGPMLAALDEPADRTLRKLLITAFATLLITGATLAWIQYAAAHVPADDIRPVCLADSV